MIRATIQDANQTISFLTSLPTVMRLVAGCSINPKDLNELLIATDIYERGLAAGLMADLMEFDKSLQRQGDTLIHQNIDRARLAGEPLKNTFQVIDDMTRQEALQPRGCPLIVIDLNTRRIQTSSDLNIARNAEVSVQIGGTETNRSVSYILPVEWKVEPLQ